MATFFKTSQVWVIDFTHDGHPRQWFKAFADGTDVRSDIQATLQDLYGPRARLVHARLATPEEETQYLHGTLPRNAFCPTGRSG